MIEGQIVRGDQPEVVRWGGGVGEPGERVMLRFRTELPRVTGQVKVRDGRKGPGSREAERELKKPSPKERGRGG